ncbi:MAG TPA: 1-acyl-sn-glycerol-3-phosphate acyltransferase [Streptosporangiaceae bacterium]|jgi:1-acyl-sn-glycerol-3-phosphate acyltransferase
MRPPPVPVRRAIIDPLWLPLAFALALLALVAALASLVTIPFGQRRRRPLRVALFAALYLSVDALLVVCCAALWLRHPMTRRRDEMRWSRAHQRLLAVALSVLVAAARPLFGFQVQVQEPPDRERIAGRPLLVIARHGGPGDSFALTEMLMSRYNRRPSIVLKESLRWDPGLDVLLGRLPTCFVQPNGRAAAQERIAELARCMRSDDAILLFPEGRNWTPRRYLGAIARLHRTGRGEAAAEAADNRNVLPPQPAGLLACLRWRPDLAVAVVAHTGLEDLVSPADVWRALPVSGSPMMVRWWQETARRLPRSDEGRREWLRLQWAIVDSWIDARKAARQRASQPESAPHAPAPAEPVAEAPGDTPAGALPAAGEPADERNDEAKPLTGSAAEP